MRSPDVIKFGNNYCPQNGPAAEALAEIRAAIKGNSRRPPAKNAAITRALRERELVVLTVTSVRSGPMFGRMSATPGRRA